MNTITMLYSGNIGLGHDFETIIRSVHKLSGQMNLRVLFVGDGKGKKLLIELIAKLDLNNFKFRSPVPVNRLPHLLALGDIHIVTQKLGTQGLIVPSKIYAILAVGRPTLFVGPQDCEPAIILRESRSGIVVTPGDIDGTADNIRRLVSDHQLRRTMGKLAREYYENNFGRDRSLSRIIKTVEAINIPDRGRI
jgi:colanic acid biosynthesis glycosyl transferase WcaI